MNPKFKKMIATFGAIALAGSFAQAQQLNYNVSDAASANWGRAAGAVVTFGENAPGTNWSPSTPVNGTAYFINSVSFIKNNNDATFDQLWIGVYDSFSGQGTEEGDLGNFLGASNASVAFGAAAEGDSLTWDFDNVSLEAADNQQLVFMFQESAGEMTTKLEPEEGELALRRLVNDANHTIAAQGSAVIHGAPVAGIAGERVLFMDVDISVVPEPSTYAAIFGLAALGAVVIRRRLRKS